ncbi:MAG: hypothetical protein WBL67_05270 [Nitrososphaeraceae archaeon]|jgi:hypothetical protein
MVFLGKRHLHIPESDHIVDGLVGLLSSANSGSIKLEFANKPVAEIGIFSTDNLSNSGKKRIKVDLLEPGLFKVQDDDLGLFDKLRTATELAQKLTDNMLTLSLFRKGKEAITLGEGAHPSFSRLITRSGDIQLNSLKESTKLRKDFKDED